MKRRLSLICLLVLALLGSVTVAFPQVSRAPGRGSGSAASAPTARTYPVVDTGQVECYDNWRLIARPASGEDFFGQDAQSASRASNYTVSRDGLTVRDNVTGLTWQRSPDTDGDGRVTPDDKLRWAEIQGRPAVLNAQRFGGYGDWRLPTIKELYSLIRFDGIDPHPMTRGTNGLTPFIDNQAFGFAYGERSAGERIIDSQYASSTLYVTRSFNQQLFGVNFADGRIKGYGNRGPDGRGKTFYLLCVRGNPSYGVNQFVENRDGTVTDVATGLMWAKADSGMGMGWHDALAWAQSMNAAHYLGHSDWRLPTAKELQSIVDYSRSPDTSSSAAIAPVFTCTAITNEAGQHDYPWYWTGTTHVSSVVGAGRAVYVCFGRALGFMRGSWTDVHGAGAQRSDPKAGDPRAFPVGRGPQGDAIRINNYVRLVRTIH